MNKRKILSLTLLFALALQFFAMPFAGRAEAATAVKNKWVRSANGAWYYYDSTGKKAAGKVGLQKINGSYYYLKKSGIPYKEVWKTINGKRYYFGKNGAAYTGYRKIGEYRYYFDKKGQGVSSKLVTINGKRYYFMYNGRAPKQAAMVKTKIWKTNAKGALVKNITSLSKEGKSLDAFIAAAGKPLTGSTTPSCAGPGNDGIYEYENFVVYTYEENGARTITYVSEKTSDQAIYSIKRSYM